MGKTTVVAALENCLIIDLEGGSRYLDALKIDVLEHARENSIRPIDALFEVYQSLKAANEQNGGVPVYKYIAIDTTTALEEIVLARANDMYRATPMGKNWTGDDVTQLPNGAGYRYTRKALTDTLNVFEDLCETLIILGHVKEKDIERDGKEMVERSLALTGKSSAILCSQVDAVGYLYREGNQTKVDFTITENSGTGPRPKHLLGKTVIIAASDPDGNITVDWSPIFK